MKRTSGSKLKRKKAKNPDGNPIPTNTKVRLQTFVVIPLNQLLMRMQLPEEVIAKINMQARCLAKIVPAVCLYTVDQIDKLLSLADFEDEKFIIMNQLKHYAKADVLVRL